LLYPFTNRRDEQCYHQEITNGHVGYFVVFSDGLKKEIKAMARSQILMNATEHDQRRRGALIAPPEDRLLLNAYVQPYPRVSTPEQIKNMSAEMQQDKRFCLLCGWTENLIIMDTRDLGISGRLRMEEREAFSDMIARIADPDPLRRVRTIVAANVSRLFRDRWGKEYSRFMEICFTYGVKVVIANKTRTGIEHIYDFSKSTDVELFRRKCEEAWSYIENQIYTMHALKDELGYAGYWVGGAVPTGFSVDLKEKINGRDNPNYKRLVPYQPWAVHVARIAERFREVAGNVNELYRQLVQENFMFPPLDETFPKEVRKKINLTPVYEDETVPEDEAIIIGYKIASKWGLKGILKNPANIGHLVYKRVIRYNTHPGIVDYMNFIYAFNRLSPTNLDGEPNNDYQEKANRYVKRHRSEKPAYLRNHLEAAKSGYFVYSEDIVTRTGGRIPFYMFSKRSSGPSEIVYRICALDIDRIFLGRFVERLQSPVAAVEFTHFLRQEQAEEEAHRRRLAELQVHIDATKSLMAKLKKRISNIENRKPERTLTPEEQKAEEEAEAELVGEINKAYREHKLELARFENEYDRLVTTGSDVQKRRSFKRMMRDAGEAWEEVVTQEDIIELVDLFVRKVTLEWISPQFFVLTIYWKDDEWETDQADCFKGACPSPHWSEEEKAILREYYPTTSGKELMRLLPLRTLESMKSQAGYMGIRREVKKKEGNVRIFCLRDLEQMDLYNLEPEDFHWKEGAKVVSMWHNVEGGNFATSSLI